MIRLFIGSSSNGEDATIEAAYLNSIEKHASKEVELTFMRQTNNPKSFWHGWACDTWPTPFSGFRWGIAEYCNFEGRAIYTDCDMINYRDLNELMEMDMEGKPLAARKGNRFGGHEFCVTVIDCAAYKEHSIPVSRLKKISQMHQRHIGKFSGNEDLVHELDPRWNVLDGEDYDLNEIYQLHFTNMATQPWTPGWFTGEPQPHPRKDVVKEYERALEEARGDGYNPEDLIPSVPFGSYDIIGR
jgi:hypothetical protein